MATASIRTINKKALPKTSGFSVMAPIAALPAIPIPIEDPRPAKPTAKPAPTYLIQTFSSALIVSDKPDSPKSMI